MSDHRYYGVNRVICSVLEEMRALAKTANYGALPGLIEEAQTMANRMEAALEDVKDIRRLHEDRSELLAEVRELEGKIKALKKQGRFA